MSSIAQKKGKSPLSSPGKKSAKSSGARRVPPRLALSGPAAAGQGGWLRGGGEGGGEGDGSDGGSDGGGGTMTVLLFAACSHRPIA